MVAVARRGDASLSQIAKDFGINDSCLRNWLRAADVEDGTRPGVTRQESDELRELQRRNRLLERENEVLRQAAAHLSRGEPETVKSGGVVCGFWSIEVVRSSRKGLRGQLGGHGQ